MGKVPKKNVSLGYKMKTKYTLFGILPNQKNNCMKYVLIIAILISGWQLKAQQTPESLLKQFFKTYKTQREKAVKDLYATNPWTNNIQADVDKLINVVKGLTPDFVGQYYGYDLLNKKEINENLIKYTYIIYYDRQPLKFVFTFYRVNQKWKLFKFMLNDQLE